MPKIETLILIALLGFSSQFTVPNETALGTRYEQQCPPPGHISSSSGPEGILSVAYSPDSKTVLIGSSDTVASLWDVQTGLLLHCLENQRDRVSSVAYSPDGKTVLTSSLDQIVT